LHDLGRRSSATEIKLRYYYALAGARSSDFAKDIVDIALADELPRGRIVLFLSTAAAANEELDKVWDSVFARREDIYKKLPDDHKDKLLAQVGRNSLRGPVAGELTKIRDDTTASAGARYEAKKAVDQIEFSVEFKQRLLPAVDGWIRTNGG
jgi:hypothetical protein